MQEAGSDPENAPEPMHDTGSDPENELDVGVSEGCKRQGLTPELNGL